MPTQKFAIDHPEYSFIWNWEMDSRFTGNYAELFRASSGECARLKNGHSDCWLTAGFTQTLLEASLSTLKVIGTSTGWSHMYPSQKPSGM